MNTREDFAFLVMLTVGAMLFQHMMESPQMMAVIQSNDYEEAQRIYDREFKLITASYE